jgi:thiol-disulfide isomerase/thioredoxin
MHTCLKAPAMLAGMAAFFTSSLALQPVIELTPEQAKSLNLQAAPTPPARPKVGDPAPDISVDGLLGELPCLEKNGTFSLSHLRGRPIVLEFSAGWCGPCRATMPHTNTLLEAFKDDSRIVFLTVTNEGQSAAAKFRESTKMVSPLAHDKNGSTWEAYWVSGVPAICLIDAAGKIVAFGHPGELTQDHLKSLIAGEKVDFARTNEHVTVGGDENGTDQDQHPINWNSGGMALDPESLAQTIADMKAADKLDSVADALSYTVLRKATKRSAISIGEDNQAAITHRGAEAVQLVMTCYGFDFDALEDNVPLPGDIYDLYIKPPDNDLNTAKAIGRTLLERTFRFTTEIVEKPAEVKVLKRIAGASPLADPPRPDGREYMLMGGLFHPPVTTSGEFAWPGQLRPPSNDASSMEVSR